MLNEEYLPTILFNSKLLNFGRRGIVSIMYRTIPVSSKVLAKKEFKEEQRRHEEKLKVIMKSKSEYFSIEKPKKIQRNERFWKDKENAIKEGNLKLIMRIEGIVHPDTNSMVMVDSSYLSKRGEVPRSLEEPSGRQMLSHQALCRARQNLQQRIGRNKRCLE